MSWGVKGGQCIRLTTLAPSCADYLKILRASTSWSPKDLSRPVIEDLYVYLYLFFISTGRPQFKWIWKLSPVFVILIYTHIVSLTVTGINIVLYFKYCVYMTLLSCMLLMWHEHFLRSPRSYPSFRLTSLQWLTKYLSFSSHYLSFDLID